MTALRPRPGGLRRLTATAAARRRLAWLVPLTLLSAFSTVQVVSGNTSDGPETATLPDGSPMPAKAIDDPASYSVPGRISLSVANGRAPDVVAAASTNGIPAAALAAYQRAQTVMDASDRACHLSWQLVAAIGRVESDHGRYGGNVLTTRGVSRPGIYGIALDGSHHTAVVPDTDAGLYDHDPVHDRAVGPMQFIPSTWADAGVDADGDGQRNPQDIDDAALAAAVYLCSGDDDLATDSGRRSAVHRYNHSREYVDLVLSIMDAYLAGDYATVPNYTTSAVVFTPDAGYTTPGRHGHRHHPARDDQSTAAPPPAAPDPTPAPEREPTPTDDDPVRTIAGTVRQVQQDVTKSVQTTDQVLTLAQATLQCTAQGYNPLLTRTAWNACIDELTTPEGA